MKSFKKMAVVAVLFVVFALVASVDQQVMAAGGSWEGHQNFGGSFSPRGSNNDLFLGSNSNTNGEAARGSFWLNLNPNTTSLEYANWDLYTNQQDTSMWYASGSMHGLLNSSENWPQSQHWSQLLESGDLMISADLNMNCYEWPSKQVLIDLQIESLRLQLLLLTASESEKAALIAQISEVQATLTRLQQQPKRQTLEINGGFEISPVVLNGSDFRYWEGTEKHYSYPNGYDNPPVITEVPIWNAEFRMDGRFVAATPEEARAMGLQFAQNVPEPSTLLLLLTSAFALGGSGIRRLLLSLRGQ